MSLPVILKPEAQQDYDEAYDWFENYRAGSGQAFVSAVAGVLRGLSANPHMHPPIFGDVRRRVVPGYKYYTVLYVIEPTRVVVISVFHASRDPAVWQARVTP